MSAPDFLNATLAAQTARNRVLLVEDDDEIAANQVGLFARKGWPTVRVASMAAARAGFGRGAFDLLIIDRGLPDGDGLDWVAELRGQDVVTPILVLTARSGAPDTIDGLDRGADDYLAKPYNDGELVARIASLFRRNQRAGLIIRGALEIDLLNRVVRYRGRRVELKGEKLFHLLAYLAIESPAVATRDMLLINVWGHRAHNGRSVVESNTADVHITRLRAALRKINLSNLIVTRAGDPYRGEENGWSLDFSVLEG
jgi:DNA-binding response OmpR family regulator